MKICPECKRTFDDDLSFCLEDGTRLVSQRSGNTTLIYPDSTTIPSPTPAPTTPTPTPVPAPIPPPANGSNKSLIAVILGVLGVLLIVVVWGGIKFGIWYLDHSSNRNSDYTPPTVATASPSPSYNPLSILSSPSPTPSPLESPSPSPDPPKDGIVSAGIYEWEGTRKIDRQHEATLRMRVTIYANNTYYQQVYLTFPDKNLDNLLGMEEKGSFTQSGDYLVLSGRESREIDFETFEWKPWTIPKDGSSSKERVRNVKENGFQLYDSSENAWYQFVRVLNLGNIDK
jgi:hypothetical protein